MSKAACFAPDVLGLAVHQTEKRVVDQESIQLCQTLHVGHIYIQEVEFSMPTYAHMVWVYFPQSHGVFRPMDLFDFLPVKSGLGSWGNWISLIHRVHLEELLTRIGLGRFLPFLHHEKHVVFHFVTAYACSFCHCYKDHPFRQTFLQPRTIPIPI